MPYVGKSMDRRRNRRIGEALAKEATLRAESVQCHACHVMNPFDCVTADGRPTKPHRKRQRLALEITRDVMLGRLMPRSGIVEHDQPCTCSHCTGERLSAFDRGE